MKIITLLLAIILYTSLGGLYARVHYDQNGKSSGWEAIPLYHLTKAQTDVLADSLIDNIKGHPRLFFNTSTFPEIKERALNGEKELLADFHQRIDALMISGTELKNKSNKHSYGFRAAESAFLYHVTGKEKYLQFAKELLKEVTDYYHFRNKANLNIHWYVYSRISTLCAYDWIYPFLSDRERKEFGSSLFRALSNMLPENLDKPPYRSNTGHADSHRRGFYGATTLRWYMGLVFHNAGIDDKKANELLQAGYAEHMKLLRHRAELADDDGGSAAATLGYAMADYPWAEFNFFHTFWSATGIDMAKEWPHVPLALNYFFWNWFAGNRHAGYGDADHFTNKLDLRQMDVFLSQILHFYGNDNPESASIAKWMQTKTQRQEVDAFPFIRFFLKGLQDNVQIQEPDVDRLPFGRFFPKMGQVLMRSGSGMDDTYAMFSAGGDLTVHRHYDNNNFVIYKKGFRALDSGTRPQPGLHLSHYYSRTIAHNCVLIHMPGEVMPKYWGERAPSEENLPVPNDGGQSNLLGSEVIAFDENEDYVYIASDATESYHRDKSELVVRQFLFIAPDVFVVFDKVVSTKDGYKKTWLLHTASEPQILSADEFSETYDEGKMFCRTIFPEKVDMEKIGGKDKQFWSGGRNWALPNNSRPDTIPLLGQWRVEISPAGDSAKANFLHLLHVGDLSLEKMVDSSPVQKNGMKGVKFNYRSKQYEVLFYEGKQEHGGEIAISKDGKLIRQEAFSQKVKPQAGLYGK